MSDHQDIPDALSREYRPDRPIATAGEDRLGRDGFVGRLARALVTPAGRASGVVIGLTGPWGSGKSSILNLLAEEFRAAAEREGRPEPVVVRFDPWLVSGRDDLISRFFKDLNAEIRRVGTTRPESKDALWNLANRLAQYGRDLAPGAAYLLFGNIPLVGTALAGAAQWIASVTGSSQSIDAQRKVLTACLAGVTTPIVVLIDELDRVEDAEVRAVAQLVRAVADFPGISYLLAYDRARVVEALGDKDMERGAGYLEKIVQLEIPLPIAFESEIGALLNVELEALAATACLPTDWKADRRFAALRSTLVPDLLTTPRDVHRVAGIFAALAPMVSGEVDWGDLLGYAALLAKAPKVVEDIRRKPAWVTVDYVGTDWFRWAGGKEMSPEERFKAMEIPADAPVRPLLGFLFPCFAEQEPENESLPSGTIRHLEALQTVLRLGLLPGGVARSEIAAFLAQDVGAMHQALQERYATGRLEAFLDRMLDVYGEVEDPDPARTLRLFAVLPSELEPGWLSSYGAQARLPRWFVRFVLMVKQKRPDRLAAIRQILADLIAEGTFDGPALLLASDEHTHGLPDGPPRAFNRAVLTVDDTRVLVVELAEAVVKAQRRGDLFPSLKSSFPLWMACRYGHWDETCRLGLTDLLRKQDEAVIAVTLMCFGGDAMVDPKALDKLADIEVYAERLKVIVARHPQEPSVRSALQKASDEVDEMNIFQQDEPNDA